MVRDLVAAGVDINRTAAGGDLPIAAAIQQGHAEVVKILAEAGAYRRASQSEQLALWESARLSGDPRIIDLFKQPGIH